MTVNVARLSNGLRIATQRMDAVETASVGVWVNVGTRHEAPEVNGISHMLEHMAFKGTRRRSARAIAEEIEAVGGAINAYTSREMTAYYATVLADDAPLAVDILADILQNSTFDPVELERERSVILQEIGQAHDTPDDIVFDRFQETAFPDQPVGRSVLGTTERVAGMARDELTGYLGRHYTAPRMVLAAAGKVDHAALVSQAEEAFAALPSGDPPETVAARYTGGDFREDRELEQVHLVLGFEGKAFDDPGYYPLALLTTIAGGGMSSRLFQEIREERGLAYSVYSFGSAYVDAGLFGVYAGTAADDLTELVDVLSAELRKLSDGLGEKEIARGRAQLKAAILMSLESTSSRAEQLGRQLHVFGRPLEVSEVTDKIDAVTNDDMKAAAAALLESPPTVSAIGPIGNLPPRESFETLFRS